MPPSGEGDEPRRLSVGGESRFVDASSSTAWTGAGPVREPVDSSDDDLDMYDEEPAPGGDSLDPADLTEDDVPSGATQRMALQPDRSDQETTARAATLASLAAANVTASSGGTTSVLVRNAIPAGSAPAPVDAGTVYVGSRRTERLTMIISTLLGTLGLLLAVATAGVDQVKYNQPVACAAYQTAHGGTVAFGCTAAAKHIAVFLPGIGIPLLVLLSLIVVWVPAWLPRTRFTLLGGLFLLLVACAVATALAYSALPKVS